MTTDSGKFHISFKPRSYEDRWTRYREKKLFDLGLSPWEIMALKYNKLTNPRIRTFLRDIRAEVKQLQEDHGLPSYEAAMKYRRENWEHLIDVGEIEEYDPYIRMGYIE